MTSYPSVSFPRDHMLAGHSNAHYQQDGENVGPGRLIVVPIGQTPAREICGLRHYLR